MDDFADLENMLVGAVFLVSLSAVLVWEQLWPKRRDDPGLGLRWKANLCVFFIGLVIRVLLVPISAVALAVLVGDRGYGLFNVIGGPPVVVFLVALLMMDFANYAQHVFMHKNPLLWRVHRVHHADTALDVSTGLRFHPFELFLGTVVDFAVIVFLGAPPGAVLVYRLARGLLSLAAHGNIALPLGFDRCLRRIFVTPDVHRVHHSLRVEEQNSNFCGGLMCWDYLFGTYRAQPDKTHEKMLLGLSGYTLQYSSSVWRMLLEPFFSMSEEGVINTQPDKRRRQDD